MRICLLGEGPLTAAVRAALAGHEIVGAFASPQPCATLTATQAAVGLSAGYRHKLTPAEWACFPEGILNLHTGYLPWNRGAYPNVWPILDGSPAGVTLHRVDAGWDTGPILVQHEVKVLPTDTAKTLYDKLVILGAGMVADYLRATQLPLPPGTPQDPRAGSFHRKADLVVDAPSLDGDHNKDLRRFLGYLRSRSFPGYGLRYRQDGKLIEATITLKEVTE